MSQAEALIAYEQHKSDIQKFTDKDERPFDLLKTFTKLNPINIQDSDYELGETNKNWEGCVLYKYQKNILNDEFSLIVIESCWDQHHSEDETFRIALILCDSNGRIITKEKFTWFLKR